MYAKVFFGFIYFLFLFLLIFFLISYGMIKGYFDYDYIRNFSFNIAEFKNQNYFFCLVLSLCFSILISFIGFALPVLLANGFIFGTVIGGIISITSLTVGSFIFYLICNFFFSEFVKNKLDKLSRYTQYISKNELLSIVFLRSLGFGLPFIVHNFIPIVLNIKKINYFLGTFIGIMPLAIQSAIGSGINKAIINNDSFSLDFFINKYIIIPILLIFTVTMIIVFIRKKFFKN